MSKYSWKCWSLESQHSSTLRRRLQPANLWSMLSERMIRNANGGLATVFIFFVTLTSLAPSCRKSRMFALSSACSRPVRPTLRRTLSYSAPVCVLKLSLLTTCYRESNDDTNRRSHLVLRVSGQHGDCGFWAVQRSK